jgi:hypothetical protein
MVLVRTGTNKGESDYGCNGMLQCLATSSGKLRKLATTRSRSRTQHTKLQHLADHTEHTTSVWVDSITIDLWMGLFRDCTRQRRNSSAVVQSDEDRKSSKNVHLGSSNEYSLRNSDLEELKGWFLMRRKVGGNV